MINTSGQTNDQSKHDENFTELNLIIDNIDYISKKFEQKNPQSIIHWALQHFPDSVTLASSLGLQSIILTHMITETIKNPDIFFIDTGRLPSETYDLLQECMNFFDIKYRIFFPDKMEVQNYIKENGPNAFYNSYKLRKKCCEIRKLNQLEAALKGYSIWISGVRRDQTEFRKDIDKIEIDERYGLIKLNPLADWTEDMVWDYIEKYDLPYNSLIDQGYASIGCEPCSRPINDGENQRDGRWWWEKGTSKECGLNLTSKSNELITLDKNYVNSEFVND